MKKLRSLALLATAALISLFAVPAGAAPPSITQDTFKGTAAVAQWFGGPEALGQPSAFFLGGFDATVASHETGSKPQRTRQPSIGAMAIWLQDPGGEPYRAEVWGLPDEWSFSIDDQLTAATLSFDCDAMILTSEEGPPIVRVARTPSPSSVRSCATTGGAATLSHADVPVDRAPRPGPDPAARPARRHS